MLRLKPVPPTLFNEDATTYKSRPDKNSLQYGKIKYFEKEISERSDEFLQDPDWYINEWQKYTDEDMPEYYLRGIPYEATHIIMYNEGFVLTPLPVIDAQCNPIVYPEDRRLVDLLKDDVDVYVLKDEMLKYFIKC